MNANAGTPIGSTRKPVADVSLGYGYMSYYIGESINNINLSFSSNIVAELSLGGTFSFNALKSSLNAKDSFSALINLKYNWYARPNVYLYSRIGFGFHSYNNSYSSNNTLHISENKTLGYQITPIGVEVGRRIRFYSELGYGNNGCFEFGLRVKFY